MKGFKVLLVWCGLALLFAACAVPLGEDYLITRDGRDLIYITDYKLQAYVPVPKAGDRPITLVNNRGDLDLSVTWKDSAGTEIPVPFDAFLPNTVYQAEISITARDGYRFYPSTPFTYPDGKVTSQNDDLGEPTRIIRVTYNNSDEADITYITGYDLQSYVPIPLEGSVAVQSVTTREDVTVAVTWSVEDPPNSANFVPIPPGGSYVFVLGKVYRADIQLTVNQGYRFRAARNFEYPAGTVITQPGPQSDPADRTLTTITYKAARAAAVISDRNLTAYIAKPVSGAMAVASFVGSQYTGTVIWKDRGNQAVLAGPFQDDTEYTAEVSLTPAIGYSFTGVGQNTFIHTGAGSISNPADSGTVRIDFSATRAGSLTVVYDTILTGRISRPIDGVTPAAAITGTQYTGAVTWIPSHSTFQLGVPYTAVLTLNAAAGYTFAGIGQNAFTHEDGAVINAVDSSTVTITFPPAASSANPAMTFGPVGSEGSALWLMNEKRDYIYTLYIDLPGGTENLTSGATLVAGDTSPANVIIDGHHRVLNIQNPGTLLTVSGDVTLTLKNITIQGNNPNHTPLLKVWRGGKLILGEGAVLIGNKGTGDTGGVWVNGGALIMNAGAKIKAMEGRRAGGVLIDANGKFFMKGGTIGGADPADGNKVSGDHGGGGVLVAQGTFDMDSGAIIQGNRAEAVSSGGGVGILAGGIFNHHGGTIGNNTAAGADSGGGVWGMGRFTMNTADAVIKENTAQEADSGGGVYIDSGGGYTGSGSFTMNNGSIEYNVVQQPNSGGGVFLRLSSGGYGPTSFMSGGTIQRNKAGDEHSGGGNNSGGGIYVASGSFGMHSGSVKENTAWANNSGGGAYIAGGGALTMTGTAAVIEGNTAKKANSGGGVYVSGSYGNFNTSGTVKNNIAVEQHSGGGVYIAPDGRSSIDFGGVIKGNVASNSVGTAADFGSGGGVYINGGTFSMYGGILGGSGESNVAAVGANGVYIAEGNFSFSYGKITGNTAGSNNYGVYVKDDRLEAFCIETAWSTANAETLPQVTEDNRVFLSPGATISFGISNGSPKFAPLLANITCGSSPISYTADPALATKLLSSSSSFGATNINLCKDRFKYEDNPVKITVINTGNYYGYFDGAP